MQSTRVKQIPWNRFSMNLDCDVFDTIIARNGLIFKICKLHVLKNDIYSDPIHEATFWQSISGAAR